MRDILHCDLNNFFASCECLNNPSIKDKPVAVGGNSEDRHGVILSANYPAKKYGIHCGVTTLEAKRLYSDIIIKNPNFKLYNTLSLKVIKIYLEYTDKVEISSIDECYLDITESKMFGNAIEIANTIRERVKKEVGLTISVGVSYNKIFAKMGSDLKKPDATTIITKDNFKKILWPLDNSALFGIGRKTSEKLHKLGIITIGDLANTNKDFLISKFGKIGEQMFIDSNGENIDEVKNIYDLEIPKSIGNSTTFYKDLTDIKDITLAFTIIAENIVERMIKENIELASTLSIVIRDNNLQFYQKQTKIEPCRNSRIFTETALKLFSKFNIDKIRLLGITVSDWKNNKDNQLSIFENKNKENDIDKSVFEIRNKFGSGAIIKANALYDKKIAETFYDEKLDKNKKE
jgi:DNA polymerase IV